MKQYLKVIIFIFALLCSAGTSFAQLDTAFWFVAPEVCKHGGAHDRPVSLIISSFQDHPVKVEISMPANPAFTPITKTIQANSKVDVDMTPYIDLIENRPADQNSPHSSMNYDQVFKCGLHIKAEEKVSVAYFIRSGNFYNTEYFALKGRNALGTEFFIPGQNEVDNTGDGYKEPKPINKFDIVASEDNTTVTIYPRKNNIMQHHKNNNLETPFTVTLNRGETYCCVAVDNKAANHLYGTHVAADKKIAITVTDDMLDFNWSGEDITGDQIVPIEYLGTEYIAVKGEMNEDRERIYVLGTEIGTQIFINGSATPAGVVNTGQIFVIPFSRYASGKKALSFTTTKPVAVWQLTGRGNEFGAAILPHTECTGSKSMMYTRTELSKTESSQSLKMNITIERDFIDKFEVKVNNTVKQGFLKASDFAPVPGNDKWMYASKTVPTSICPVGASIIITNESNFHVGAFEGGTSGGCSYGFFTDFAMGYKLELSTNHATDMNIFCEGDSLSFIFNNNEDLLSKILWDGPNGFHAEGDALSFPSIRKDQAGVYRVSGEMREDINTCGVDYAEVEVGVLEIPHPDLGADTMICAGDTLTLDATCSAGKSYLWNTGATTPTITVTEEGTYKVTVMNGKCEDTDSIFVHVAPNPVPFIGVDSLFCDEFTYIIGDSIESANYMWSTGETTPLITVTVPGIYSVVVDSLGCIGYDTVIVSNIISPVVNLGNDTLYCDHVYKLLDAGEGFDSYKWNTEAESQTIVATEPGDFWCVAYLDKCWGADTIHIDIVETPTVDILVSGDMCVNGEMQLIAVTDAETMEWNTGETSPTITISRGGIYWVEAANGPCDIKVEKIIEPCPCSFWLPSAFTPNKDGLNDMFTPSTVSENLFETFNLYIYNRWGQLIFKGNSCTEGWDGTFNGKPVPQDVYTWVVQYSCSTSPEDPKRQHGSVTVLRN